MVEEADEAEEAEEATIEEEPYVNRYESCAEKG